MTPPEMFFRESLDGNKIRVNSQICQDYQDADQDAEQDSFRPIAVRMLLKACEYTECLIDYNSFYNVTLVIRLTQDFRVKSIKKIILTQYSININESM